MRKPQKEWDHLFKFFHPQMQILWLNPGTPDQTTESLVENLVRIKTVTSLKIKLNGIGEKFEVFKRKKTLLLFVYTEDIDLILL